MTLDEVRDGATGWSERTRNLESFAEQICKVHALCDAHKQRDYKYIPRWMNWFNLYVGTAIALFFGALLVVAAQLPSLRSHPFLLITVLLLTAMGFFYYLAVLILTVYFELKDLREWSNPFKRTDAAELSDELNNLTELARFDSDIIKHVMASLERTATGIDAHIEWLKGIAMGCLAGLATILYKGSALASLLQMYLTASVEITLQIVLLFGFSTMFVAYLSLWRRSVRSQNRARILRYVEENRAILQGFR